MSKTEIQSLLDAYLTKTPIEVVDELILKGSQVDVVRFIGELIKDREDPIWPPRMDEEPSIDYVKRFIELFEMQNKS